MAAKEGNLGARLVEWRRTFRRQAAGSLLLLLAVAVFLGVSLGQSFDRYQVAADDDLENLTLNLERYLFTRLQAADLVLQSAAQSFALMSAAGPVSETEFNAALFELQKRLPDAPALRAADHTGLVRYGGGGRPCAAAQRRAAPVLPGSQELLDDGAGAAAQVAHHRPLGAAAGPAAA